MIIRIGNKFWSAENSNGTTWYEIPESAISYELFFEEPTEERAQEMCAAYNAALKLDEANSMKDFMGLPASDMTTPHADAVAANFGQDWLAYKAFESFRSACEGS
jgi:hypothetical protein